MIGQPISFFGVSTFDVGDLDVSRREIVHEHMGPQPGIEQHRMEDRVSWHSHLSSQKLKGKPQREEVCAGVEQQRGDNCALQGERPRCSLAVTSWAKRRTACLRRHAVRHCGYLVTFFILWETASRMVVPGSTFGLTPKVYLTTASLKAAGNDTSSLWRRSRHNQPAKYILSRS